MVFTVLMVPGSLLTLGAGFAFKKAYGSTLHAVLIGSLSVWVGASTGDIIAMLIGRFVLYSWVKKKAEKYPLLKAIDFAIKKEGIKLIILLRLCPLIPFDMLNYLMGISGITITHYCIGNLGMIPGTIAYVFIGTTISDIADASNGSSDQSKIFLIFAIVGSILAIIGIVWISIVAKRYLKDI